MPDIFSPQLRRLENGERVTVTGYVTTVRKFSTHFAVRLRDPFGHILVCVERNDAHTEGEDAVQRVAKKGDRLRIDGVLNRNDKNECIVQAQRPATLLGNASDKMDDLSSAMKDQASRLLLAQAIRFTGSHLREHEAFVEFDSRVISTNWAGGGLEPMKIIYPGFGCAVPLATSPAAQVMDFINTTGVHRAFTTTTSFSTTYRFSESGAELRVVVGKAVGMDSVKLTATLLRLVRYVLKSLDPETYGTPTWTKSGLHTSGALEMRKVDFPTDPGNSDSSKSSITVTQIVARGGLPLAEGFREVVGESSDLAGFSVYPGHFLTLLSATPARNLRDLRGYRVW